MSSKQKKFKQAETSERSKPHAEITASSAKDPNSTRDGPGAKDNDLLLTSSSGSAVESRSTTDRFDGRGNVAEQCATAVDDENRDPGDISSNTNDNNIRDRSAPSDTLNMRVIRDILDTIVDNINDSDDASNAASQMGTSYDSESDGDDVDGARGPRYRSAAADRSTTIGAEFVRVVQNTITKYCELMKRRLDARKGTESGDECRLEEQLRAQHLIRQRMRNVKDHMEKENEIMSRRISKLKRLCLTIEALKATLRATPEHVLSEENNPTRSDNDEIRDMHDRIKRYEEEMCTYMEMYKQIGRTLQTYSQTESQDRQFWDELHQLCAEKNQRTLRDISEEQEEINE